MALRTEPVARDATVGAAFWMATSARGSLGLVQLIRPSLFAGVAGGRADPPLTGVALRVLGARHVAEAAVLTLRPTRRMARRVVVIDGLHALSMVALLAASSRYRRSAAAGAALAVVMGGAAAVTRP